MPEGMRWNFHVSPPCTMVCPALLPPWKRMTASARSARRSMTLPLPSSPHCAPTMTVPGIASLSVGAPRLRHVPPQVLRLGLDVERRHAHVGPADGDDLAHLLQPGDGPPADLAVELVELAEVRRDDDRLLGLVARVDDRVELLEDPVAGLLGADVVEVEQVD